ncbi:MAG: DUF1549 and DUF1553 domain-containing protein [Bryobacteraceae bacterium]
MRARYCSALLGMALLMAQDKPDGKTVVVDLFEDVPAGAEFQVQALKPVATYSEPAFAFVHTPTKFAPNAIPLDRSAPFILRAGYKRKLPAGEYQFRLRARGAAVFQLDGKDLLNTKAQKPNTTGDDPVPPPVDHSDPLVRPLQYPHQDSVMKVKLDGTEHNFTLIAVIGGKGLYPSPGELSVSFAHPGEVDRLLGPDGSATLTDTDWDKYVAASDQRHRQDDLVRRRQASAEVVAAWEARHEKIRAALKMSPGLAVPNVQPGTPAYNDIDRFLGQKLEKTQTAPSPLTADLEFLRRVSLDLTGLIPTPAEITAYLATPAKTRRAKAVDRLLESPSWADHWVAYWQDVLAENPGILKPDLNNTGPFRWWLHQSFTDQLPFDRIAAELIDMEGSQTLGAPAAFSQATLNDAPYAAKADIIAQAFLGQKLQCARCHDAPFHPFKQKDLFSLSAMLAGKPVKLPSTSTVPVVEGGRRPMVTIALKAGESIAPEWPFKTLVEHSETAALPEKGSVPSRHEVAAYVISPENERFAQVAVNRIWKHYMGLGIVEPADDWTRGKPSHPELLAYLSREFMMSGYDIKALARLIVSSHAYQRKPVGNGSDQMSAETRIFAGPVHRNMTAEQLVDSMHLAAGKEFECEDMNLNPAGDRPAKQFLNMGKPTRGWQMTALSNERDRPALALPIAQSIVDVMSTFGWRQSRQNPATTRDDAPSPMQTLILANGVLGTRMVRLSDDSAYTELALRSIPAEELVKETFLKVMSRPPSTDESSTFVSLLKPYYQSRKVKGAESVITKRQSDNRVSWSNHLSAEATLIRMEEERKLRMGDQPTKRLTTEFRERYEDALWAMINSPEFVMVP